MQKVYLLLRNNKQSGPYSLEEMVSLGLKTDDLIWVEGRSFSWSHPSEIDSLKDYLPTQTIKNATAEREEPRPETVVKTGVKKIFVSLPGNKEKTNPAIQPAPEASDYDLERKAEELRKRAETYLQNKTTAAIGEDLIETKYARSLNEVEEEYTSWVYNKARKKSFNKKPLILASIAIILLLSGYFIFKPDSSEKKNIIASSELAASADDLPQKVNGEEPGLSEKNSVADEGASAINKKIESAQSPQATAKRKAAKHSDEAQNNSRKQNIPIVEVPTTVASEDEIKTVQKEVDDKTGKPDESTVAETAEKKKTLKEKIGGFFEKIKNKRAAQTETEETHTPGTVTNGLERKSTKRDEAGQSGEGNADLSKYAHVSTNQSGNWMMGVRGLKITLRNTSTEAIKTALVEVRYYNDQNELLDKKQIQFTNIASKKAVTQAAPDHRLADHADAHLVSAVGDVGYAKQ